MNRPKFSRFTYSGRMSSKKVGIYLSPSTCVFDIVCDVCGCILFKKFNPNSAAITLHRCDLEEQDGVVFYSVVDGDQTVEYCKKCIDIAEIAPL